MAIEEKEQEARATVVEFPREGADPGRLGFFLRTVREARGWSMEEVARRLDGQLTATAVSLIESGESVPKIETLIALSDLYGVPIGVLTKLAYGVFLEYREPPEWCFDPVLVTKFAELVEAIRGSFRPRTQRPGRPVKKKMVGIVAALATCPPEIREAWRKTLTSNATFLPTDTPCPL